MPVQLSFISLICRDLIATSDFYRGLFDLEPVEELTSEHFRALRIGGTILGFGGSSTFDMLNIPQTAIPSSATAFWTFEADSDLEVKHLTGKAIAAGAVCLKEPARTYYGSWQSVLRDPEGNIFRINKTE